MLDKHKGQTSFNVCWRLTLEQKSELHYLPNENEQNEGRTCGNSHKVKYTSTSVTQINFFVLQENSAWQFLPIAAIRWIQKGGPCNDQTLFLCQYTLSG